MDPGSIQLTRDEMVSLLKQEGEPFTEEELQMNFGYLVGKTNYKEALPKDFVTAEEFASDLLGFEEFEDGEEEMEAADGAGQQQEQRKTGLMGVNEIIPEEDGF
jgi:hypothetical protein